MEVADDFGDGHGVARVDLGVVFLGAAGPHGAFDAGAALEEGEGFVEGLAGGEFTQACGAGLGDRDAEGHPVFFEGDVDEFELVAGDLFGGDALDLADAVGGVDDVVALDEVFFGGHGAGGDLGAAVHAGHVAGHLGLLAEGWLGRALRLLGLLRLACGLGCDHGGRRRLDGTGLWGG